MIWKPWVGCSVLGSLGTGTDPGTASAAWRMSLQKSLGGCVHVGSSSGAGVFPLLQAWEQAEMLGVWNVEERPEAVCREGEAGLMWALGEVGQRHVPASTSFSVMSTAACQAARLCLTPGQRNLHPQQLFCFSPRHALSPRQALLKPGLSLLGSGGCPILPVHAPRGVAPPGNMNLLVEAGLFSRRRWKRLCSRRLEEEKHACVRWPGVEPGSTAWKAAMLTTIPPTHADLCLPPPAPPRRHLTLSELSGLSQESKR